jgi:hypothetical protein
MSSVTSGVCRGVFICFTCIHSPSSTATFFTCCCCTTAQPPEHTIIALPSLQVLVPQSHKSSMPCCCTSLTTAQPTLIAVWAIPPPPPKPGRLALAQCIGHIALLGQSIHQPAGMRSLACRRRVTLHVLLLECCCKFKSIALPSLQLLNAASHGHASCTTPIAGTSEGSPGGGVPRSG